MVYEPINQPVDPLVVEAIAKKVQKEDWERWSKLAIAPTAPETLHRQLPSGKWHPVASHAFGAAIQRFTAFVRI